VTIALAGLDPTPAAAAELVEHSAAVVVELAGSPFHTDAGLHPIRNLIERRCSISRLTDPGERLQLMTAEVAAAGLDPATVVPLLAPVLAIAADAGYQPVAAEGQKLYELIAEAVQTYLLACLNGGTGLVVAEDLHWFDPSTLDVLGRLLEAANGRLLVVFTGRPGGWLPADCPVTVFDLTPLSDGQSDELMIALNPGLSADERALVAGRCDGVPFYIEQIMAGLTESGVPEALYEPLFARLRATANVVPVLEAAAVIGRQMDRGLLCAVVDLSDDEVDGVIDELEDALVLEPWGTDNWRFRHELLREVATELAPPSVRTGLHAKVADALVGDVGGERDWRLVAAHYERAERFDAAASAYQQAASEARRRGALTEARTYLSLGLTQLDRAAPGLDRDRREMALRLERGSLAAAAEGYQSGAAAIDFERCLQLAGTDLRDDELAVTLVALVGYYTTRADLRRTVYVLESLRAGLEQGRQWFGPMIEGYIGLVAWLRGEFDAARTHFEQATAVPAAADQHQIEAVWFSPSDAIAGVHIHLATIGLMRGDLTGAEAEFAHAARRANELGFPQGAWNLAYTRCMEGLVWIEAGQLDRAAVLFADVSELAERHGFDAWRLAGATWQATVSALAALGADDLDPTKLAAHIATLTTFVDTWRTVGMNIYRTIFEGVLGRLLIAAGQPEAARNRLDSGLQLAQDTGMCFYDAELLYGYVPTPTPTPMPAKPTSPPPSNWPTARARPSSNCVLRSTFSSLAARPRALRWRVWSIGSPSRVARQNWREPRPPSLMAETEISPGTF
jgi:tetratricopeptide (TPR) repeat protein